MTTPSAPESVAPAQTRASLGVASIVVALVGLAVGLPDNGAYLRYTFLAQCIAFILGVIARRSTTGKIGMVLSAAIALLLYGYLSFA